MSDLLSYLEAHRTNAVAFFDDEVAVAQQEALDRYMGEFYGDEMEGRSKALSLDVREAVDWMMPDLMRIFASGEKVVDFTPVGEEDQENAQQRIDYVNHVFFKDNDGYMILHDCFKDAMIQKNGFIKVWWEEKEDVEPEIYEGASTIALAVFQGDNSVEIVDIKTKTISDEEFAKMDPRQQILFPDRKEHRISVTRDKGGRVRIMAVPPEEILIARESRTLESSAYVNHRVEKTVSDIIQEGLASEDKAKGLFGEDEDASDRKRQRFKDENEVDSPETEETRKIWVYEEYVRFDEDGDGIAERRQVIRVNDEILSNEISDMLQIVTFTGTPMPHKVYGLGLADYASDIARIKTVITRQMLDNLYLTNAPRKVVNMQFADERTIDQMLDTRIGAIVQVNGPVSEAIKTDTTEFVANAAFDMLAYMDSVGERRTGINRTSQGLPDETLSRTATEVTKLAAAAQGRKELIVRNLASSLALLFEKIDKIIMNHQDFARVIRLREEAVTIDPRSWNAKFDTTINVGLGTGNKEQKLAALEFVLAKQITSIEAGSGLSDINKVHNTLADWSEAAGLSVARYFINPQTPGFEEPEEDEADPAAIKAETDLAKTQMNIQSREKTSAAELVSEEKIAAAGLTSDEKIAFAELEGETRLTALKLALGEPTNVNLRKP